MTKKEDLLSFAFRVTAILNGNDSVENRITEALDMIGKYFQYEYGFVYQTDITKHFRLMETYGNEKHILREDFAAKALPEKLIDVVTRQKFYHCCVGNSCARERQKEDTGIFRLFGITSLSVLHFEDIKGELIGFVGFVNKSGNNSHEEQELKTIRQLLTLISKEITIREYQNREVLAIQTLENIMDNTGVDIYVNDFETHDLFYINESMAAPYGGKKHFQNKKCWEALYDDKTEPCDFCPRNKLIDEHGHPSKVYSWDYERPMDKSWFRVFSRAFRWIDGRMAHVITSVDITQNKRNEALIKQMAEQDCLTGLPNRRKLIQDCNEDIEQAIPHYVLFLDLDGFKIVNDLKGHKSGDELLKQIAAFFKSTVSEHGQVYRQSGDEFIIVTQDMKKEDITLLAQTILRRFNEKPWRINGGEVYCNVSIGIAHYPSDAQNTEDLLHIADAAMYAVKQEGKKGCRFAHENVNIVL